MIIRDEIKGFTLFLERDGRLHHPEIISEVQRAAGLDAGQNTHKLKIAMNEEGRKAGNFTRSLWNQVLNRRLNFVEASRLYFPAM